MKYIHKTTKIYKNPVFSDKTLGVLAFWQKYRLLLLTNFFLKIKLSSIIKKWKIYRNVKSVSFSFSEYPKCVWYQSCQVKRIQKIQWQLNSCVIYLYICIENLLYFRQLQQNQEPLTIIKINNLRMNPHGCFLDYNYFISSTWKNIVHIFE